MLRYRLWKIFTVAIFLVLTQPLLAAERLTVFVSIAPQRYFVEQIGGSHVEVNVLVKPGASPHTYEPKPRQMAALSKSAIYFAIGVSFEKVWLGKIAAANPKMSIVHTDSGIKKLSIAAHHHEEEVHEDEDHDENEARDPHIWLSPPLVKIQAQHILKALQKASPTHRTEFTSNYHRFITTIDRLDTKLQKILAGKSGLQFMVFHPSWGYFADAYHLKQVSIEVEGKSPKPSQLKELIKHARENNIKVIFVQPQFSTRSARLIAKEIQGQVVPADPLAEDWWTNLRGIAEKFKDALR